MMISMNANLHRWAASPDEAIQIQKDLRERVVLKWDKRPVALIGSVDVSTKTESALLNPGHLMDVTHATDFVLACGAGYRLPEPTR
jgi:deoxyinosine 3'endonuclease (endonuclease V)